MQRLDHPPDRVIHVTQVGGVHLERAVTGSIGVVDPVMVGVDPVLRRLDRHVHGGERHVAEPRLRLRLHPLQRFVHDQVGHVPARLGQLAVAMPGPGIRAFLVAVAVGIDAAGKAAVRVVEPVPVWTEARVRAEVPLAEQAGGVAGVAQRRRQRLVAVRKHRRVGRLGGMPSEAPGMAAGQQRHARGRAHRADVVLVELDAVPRQPIEVGRADLRAVVAHVTPSQVVGEDVEDVGRAGGLGRGQTSTQEPLSEERYTASNSATERRASRPSHCSAEPVRMAPTMSAKMLSGRSRGIG